MVNKKNEKNAIRYNFGQQINKSGDDFLIN
jgi:hypothetical protein